ncbi:MAG: hypothetical protein ACJ8EB_14090, partial [Allosphingosinicella sp.]
MTSRAFLLLGSAAAALLAGRADAQAFQGTHVVTWGAATRIPTGATSETIRVDSPSAVLLWSPTDAAIGGPAIDFLPAGNVATFINGPNNPSFMVLNRIIPKDPSRAIALNGTIISQLQSAGGTARGGTVAFYSPGGILIGAKAVIDVGSLLLTTIDPALDPNGNFFVANTYALTGAVDAKSRVTIAAGAQISAQNEGSYIAVAAPIVEQHGVIDVNGSAALVAAEGVSLTINSGLFDIVVKTGSSSAVNTLVHDGTTQGPASTGAGDNHRIYMVAVPKNQAITALLEGRIGFAPAINAAVKNGEIILSAGRNVSAADAFAAAPPTPAASFLVHGGTFTSDVLGTALADFIIDSANSDTSFSGNADLTGDLRARIDPAAGRTVSVAGNLALRSDGTAFTRSPGLDNVGGEAGIATNGSTVSVAGDLLLSAIGRGGFDQAALIAGNGTGGAASVVVNGGAVTVGGKLTADASGAGGTGAKPAMSGGAGTGGTASLTANSGTLAVTGTTKLLASGTGAATAGGVAQAPAGTGGTAMLAVAAPGAMTLTGAASLDATGTGGAIVSFGGGTGGTGQGGNAQLTAKGGTLGAPGGVQLDATGFGGGQAGGAGTGGTATLEAGLGAKVTLGPAAVIADGQGAAATADTGGAGGAGAG